MNYFIYKFLNKEDEVIYVGKTNNIFARMNQHSQKKYFKSKEVVKVLFAQCLSPTDRDIYELYYINKYFPKYNDKQNYGIDFSIELKDLEFFEYDDNIKLKPLKQETKNQNINCDNFDLFKSSYKLSLIELKLLLFCLKKINLNDTNILYKLNVSDFKEIMNTENGSIYKSIKNALNSLKVKNCNDNKICDYSYYEEGCGCFEIKFSSYFHKLLLQLKLIINDDIINKLILLRSIYSIRLYLLLIISKGNIKQYSIDDLKFMFAISKDMYNNYFDFKTRVIEPAQKELKTKMNFIFSFNPIKKSKKVCTIEFELNKEDAVI